MRIFIWLVTILTVWNLPCAYSESRVYFKIFLPEKGFAFGNASNDIDSDNKFTVTFGRFEIDFKHRFNLAVVAINDDGSVKRKQSCTELKTCTLDLGVITSGTVQISLDDEFGNAFGIYFLKFADKKITHNSDKCEFTEFTKTHSQCLCRSDENGIENCKDAMPLHCYDLEPNTNPVEVPFKTFGFALKLSDKLNTKQIEPAKFYAFDETSHQYYTIGWNKVPAEIDGNPLYEDVYFRLQIRLSPTNIATIPEAKKTEFLITNHDLNNGPFPVIFDNAFCQFVEEENLLTCACCEFSRGDKICETYYSNKLYFSTIDYTYGLVNLQGMVWIGGDKKVRIQFDTINVTPGFDVKFRLATKGALGIPIADSECTNPSKQKWCPLDVSDTKILMVKLEFVSEGKQSEILTVDIKKGDFSEVIKGQCKTQLIGTYTTQCLCNQLPTASKFQCLQQPTDCNEVPATSGIIMKEKKQFSLDLSNKDALKFPVEKTVKLTAFDRKSAKKFLLQFNPMNPENPKYASDNSWATQVYLTEIDLQTKTANKMDLMLKLGDSIRAVNFNYAFCKSTNGLIICTCCMGEDSQQESGCSTVTDIYKFYFTNNSPLDGFVFGGGLLWFAEPVFNLKMNSDEPYGSLKQFKLECDKCGKNTCSGEEVCPLDNVPKATNIKFGLSIKEGSFSKIGDIEMKGYTFKNKPNPCVDVTDSGAQDAEMCMCYGDEQRIQQNKCLSSGLISCKDIDVNGGKSRATVIFKLNESFPFLWKTPRTVYIKDGSGFNDFVRLVYEPVETLTKHHTVYTGTLRMRLQLSKTDSSHEAESGSVNFIVNNGKIYSFEEATCYLNPGGAVCFCCDEYDGYELARCAPATHIFAEMNVQFSVAFKDNSGVSYGQYFGRFVLSVNVQSFFTIRWIKQKQAGPALIRIRLENTDTNQTLDCFNSDNCVLIFKQAPGDLFVVYATLQGPNKDDLEETKTEIFKFEKRGDDIVEAGSDKCVENDLSRGKNCVCPEGKDFDSTCSASEIQTCRTITAINSNKVSGQIYKNSSFSLKLDKTPKQHTPIFVSGDKTSYSLTYWIKPQLDSSSKLTDYLIYLNPTQSDKIGITAAGKIETNFDELTNIVQFNDITCTVNEDKTEWICQCCLQGECGAVEKDDVTTTTAVPNGPGATKPPYNPDLDPCKYPTSNLTDTICKDKNVTVENVDQKIEEVIQVNVTNADNQALNALSEFFVDLAKVKGANTTQRYKMLGLFDQVLTVNNSVFKANGHKVSASFRDSIHKIIADSFDDTLSYLNGKEFAVHRRRLNCADQNRWNGLADDGQAFRESDEDSKADKASIHLSLDTLCKDKVKEATVPAYFVIYRNGKLFNEQTDSVVNVQKQSLAASNEDKTAESKSKTNDCKKQFSTTNDIVVTGVVLEENTNIQAKMSFKKADYPIPMHANLAVTWWNNSEWSEKQKCSFKEEGDEYIAICNHLTDFALLIEKSPSDPVICSNFLSKFGFWLSIASFVFLLLMILLFLTRLLPVLRNYSLMRVINGELQGLSDGILIGYVCVMAAFYFFYTVFINESLTGSAVFCKLVAAFLYSLFLSAMFLNLFQSWSLIKMCGWSIRSYQILDILTMKRLLFPVSIGVSLLTSLVVYFADGAFFYRHDRFCWIRPQSSVYAALIPVVLVFLNTLICFIIFTVRKFPHRFACCGVKPPLVEPTKLEIAQRSTNFKVFIALIFSQFLLGMPWIIQYPALYSSDPTAWHYLFVIFNGLNGLCMFFIFMYGRAKVLYRWKKANGMLEEEKEEDEEPKLSEENNVFSSYLNFI